VNRNQLASAIGLVHGVGLVFPLPDGTAFTMADSKHTCHCYRDHEIPMAIHVVRASLSSPGASSVAFSSPTVIRATFSDHASATSPTLQD
jgi:hypothetical protein